LQSWVSRPPKSGQQTVLRWRNDGAIEIYFNIRNILRNELLVIAISRQNVISNVFSGRKKARSGEIRRILQIQWGAIDPCNEISFGTPINISKVYISVLQKIYQQITIDPLAPLKGRHRWRYANIFFRHERHPCALHAKMRG
jgi:hypothetical protein